jgi:Domain of unknown function (DUF4333)
MNNPRLASVILVLAAAAHVVGCQVSVGGTTVPQATVEETTMKILTAQVGAECPKITCPGDLKATVGTVMVCSMTIDGKLADVTITVTSVEGTNVKWDVKNSPHAS